MNIEQLFKLKESQFRKLAEILDSFALHASLPMPLLRGDRISFAFANWITEQKNWDSLNPEAIYLAYVAFREGYATNKGG